MEGEPNKYWSRLGINSKLCGTLEALLRSLRSGLVFQWSLVILVQDFLLQDMDHDSDLDVYFQAILTAGRECMVGFPSTTSNPFERKSATIFHEVSSIPTHLDDHWRLWLQRLRPKHLPIR